MREAGGSKKVLYASAPFGGLAVRRIMKVVRRYVASLIHVS